MTATVYEEVAFGPMNLGVPRDEVIARTEEALAALRLFHEAAGRETATADFARRVLRFLFRARHDAGLLFTACEV